MVCKGQDNLRGSVVLCSYALDYSLRDLEKKNHSDFSKVISDAKRQ